MSDSTQLLKGRRLIIKEYDSYYRNNLAYDFLAQEIATLLGMPFQEVFVNILEKENNKVRDIIEP